VREQEKSLEIIRATAETDVQQLRKELQAEKSLTAQCGRSLAAMQVKQLLQQES
jgi:hypothetical protein